jgi:DNA polymerase-3 subunit delta
VRLDGAGVRSDAEAAALIGTAPFPARKALAQSRKLGSDAISRAVRLVAQADLDLRGASEWPSVLVLEVLVARLSRLA